MEIFKGMFKDLNKGKGVFFNSNILDVESISYYKVFELSRILDVEFISLDLIGE